MSQTTIQFPRSSQGVPRLCRYYVLGLFLLGCEAPPAERIQGNWIVDPSATLRQSEFQDIGSPAQDVLAPLAKEMLEVTRFKIGRDSCVRSIGPLTSRFPCRASHTSQRDMVSLESRDQQGRKVFIRARPVNDQLEFEIDGHTLILRRDE